LILKLIEIGFIHSIVEQTHLLF